MSAVPKAVPTAVAPSAQNSVPVLTDPQLGPYEPMSGSAIIPVVPRTDDGNQDAMPNPMFGGNAGTGGPAGTSESAAPSLPRDGYLFTAGPIDSHYTGEQQSRDPYGKVNNPPTRGMQTFVKDYQNHIAESPQNVDPNGFRNSPDQQRTSVMRVTTPPHGIGYAPETFVPHQLPQHALSYRYQPVTGTDAYGTGVLNADTYGAGQTAGGIGGNNYTPSPGPPATNSTAGDGQGNSGMPMWG